MLDGLVFVPQEKRQTTECQQEPTDVALVVELLVQLPCPLRVVAREDPVALPLRDERSLEIGVRDRAAVADDLRQLEGQPRMSARRRSQGRPDRSASARASSKRPIAVEMLDSL